MAAQTSRLHIRVDDDIKGQATVALTAMGLSVSDAVQLLLLRLLIDLAFPLELKVPMRKRGPRWKSHAHAHGQAFGFVRQLNNLCPASRLPQVSLADRARCHLALPP